MIISKPSNFSLSSSSLPRTSRKNPRKLGFFPIRPSLSNKVSSFPSSFNNYNQNSRYNPWRNRIREEHEEEERQVQCEVDVISWRERRIRGWILVYAHVDSVWNILTDYERLADFVPNLVSSGRIPCPHPGRIWVEQRGLQRALYWHIEARVMLDLQEFPNLSNGRELHFSMVDGDFKKFEGKWSLKAGVRSSTTTLSYEVNVIPTFNFPAIFIERIISSDLPVNLRAVAFRAEGNFEGNQKILRFESVVHPTPNAAYASSCMDLSGALSPTNKLPSNEFKEHYSSSNFAPLSTSYSSELTNNWGLYGKVCRLDKRCMVDEVHLRRYDGLLEDGGVHRFVVASITVKAPVREVWDILTAYETLPEFVPNLAISKILSRENNKVRILQEGCKGLLYMVLHARVVLDLREQREHEISFEQVEGDFDSFQGKWLLEQLGNHHTLLKYIVESKLQKDPILAEAIVEEVIYEDLPSNLCAIRDFVENQKVAGSNYLGQHNDVKYPDERITSYDNNNEHVEQTKPPEHVYGSDGSNPSQKRPKVPGLQKDIEVLKAELLTFISKYGQEGFMPMRKQLRLHGRVDIEKAITRMGGFRKIASLMNLSLAYKHRKPKGYWDNLENMHEEINRFQRSWGMDLTYMPSRKSFERAGRYDIARALEKWGGLHEVSRLLSLKLRHPSRQANLAKDKKIDDSVADVGDDRDDTNYKALSVKPHVSEDIQKWLSKLNQLDINW